MDSERSCIICLENDDRPWCHTECCGVILHVDCSDLYLKHRPERANCPHCRFPLYATTATSHNMLNYVTANALVDTYFKTECSQQYMRVLKRVASCYTSRLWNDDYIIHRFVRANDERVYKILVEAGGNINAKGMFGNTPLHVAIINRIDPQPLLQIGADIDSQNDILLTPLHLAIKYNSVKTLILLKKYITTRSLTIQDSKGNTALHHASMYESKAKLEIMVSNKTLDMNITNKYNVLPLHVAIKCKNSKAVQIMIQRGASVSTRMATLRKEIKEDNTSAVKVVEYVTIMQAETLTPVFLDPMKMRIPEYANTILMYTSVVAGLSRQAIDTLVHAHAKEKVPLDGEMWAKCITIATLGQARSMIKNQHRLNIINKVHIPSYLMSKKDPLLIQKCKFIRKTRPNLMIHL